MKALLLILCPALTFAATITTGVACSGNALIPTVSSGANIQCSGPYSEASTSASMTETGNSLSATLGAEAEWNQPLQQPYDGPARASATIMDLILTQGTGTGYVEIIPNISGRWDPDGGTATLQISINGTQEILCGFICPSYASVFAPITLGSPVLITFSAIANGTDVGSGAYIGGSVSLLFLGADQETPVSISDVTAAPEPSVVLLALASFALVGWRLACSKNTNSH
jgi:hypothetical protein